MAVLKFIQTNQSRNLEYGFYTQNTQLMEVSFRNDQKLRFQDFYFPDYGYRFIFGTE